MHLREQVVMITAASRGMRAGSQTEPSEAEQCTMTYVGGGMRDVLQPSIQVGHCPQVLSMFEGCATQSGPTSWRQR